MYFFPLKHQFLTKYIYIPCPGLICFPFFFLALSYFRTQTHTHTVCLACRVCTAGRNQPYGRHEDGAKSGLYTWCVAVLPCVFCVCACVFSAEGNLHLNIYQGQRLPKGESCVVFTGRLPNEWMKTTLRFPRQLLYLRPWARHLKEAREEHMINVKEEAVLSLLITP